MMIIYWFELFLAAVQEDIGDTGGGGGGGGGRCLEIG